MLQRHPLLVKWAIGFMLLGLLFVAVFPNLNGIGVLVGFVGFLLIGGAVVGDWMQNRIEHR